jgi:hypothetical protein
MRQLCGARLQQGAGLGGRGQRVGDHPPGVEVEGGNQPSVDERYQSLAAERARRVEHCELLELAALISTRETKRDHRRVMAVLGNLGSPSARVGTPPAVRDLFLCYLKTHSAVHLDSYLFALIRSSP